LTDPHPATVYGIANCDTVKRARAWLQQQGVSAHFHDFKKQGLSPELLDAWLARLGEQGLVNRRGTTWRKLDDASRLAAETRAGARKLMLAQPSVIKRPVVSWPDGSLTVGFDLAEFTRLAG
jgi:Spx/MgsR family transcriptional regulator